MATNNPRNTSKVIWLVAGIVGLFIVVGLSNDFQHDRERKAAAAACLINPACQDRRARTLSLFDSEPVRSSTGKLFFKGKRCTDDCSGHLAGYKWAAQFGATKEEICIGKSESFQEGCIAYVDDRKDEIASEERASKSLEEDEHATTD